MSLKKLVSKYITSTGKVLEEMEVAQKPVTIEGEGVERILEYVRAYFQDAKYYKEKRKFKVSLTSIAYCEGLLDALKLLGAVKFEWSTEKEERRGR